MILVLREKKFKSRKPYKSRITKDCLFVNEDDKIDFKMVNFLDEDDEIEFVAIKEENSEK